MINWVTFHDLTPHIIFILNHSLIHRGIHFCLLNFQKNWNDLIVGKHNKGFRDLLKRNKKDMHERQSKQNSKDKVIIRNTRTHQTTDKVEGVNYILKSFSLIWRFGYDVNEWQDCNFPKKTLLDILIIPW